jgi:hypothetical protein
MLGIAFLTLLERGNSLLKSRLVNLPISHAVELVSSDLDDGKSLFRPFQQRRRNAVHADNTVLGIPRHVLRHHENETRAMPPSRQRR